MKTFNQLLAENLHVSAALRNTLPPELKDAIPLPTIASLRRSAQALEELIIVKAAVLDEARVALNDLREAIQKLEGTNNKFVPARAGYNATKTKLNRTEPN